MKVKSESEVTQSCPTLCDPIEGSPPGSAVPGVLQARTLEWVAISFSNRANSTTDKAEKGLNPSNWYLHEHILIFGLSWWLRP